MPKFNKIEEQLETMFDKWLFVLCNLSQLMTHLVAFQERIFIYLFKVVEIARFSIEGYYAYEESLKNYRDWYSTVNTAEYKGCKIGREEGLKEGLERGLQQGLQ